MKTLFILLLSLSLAEAHQRTQVHMGTFISVKTEDDNRSNAIFALFDTLDQYLSTYKSDSEISQLNQKAEGIVSPVTQKILERSLEMYHLSDGAFDITIGSFSHSGYHFGYQNEHIPSGKELQKLEKFVGIERIVLEKNHVRLLPGTMIDLGGIGKGYGVDLAIEMLEGAGIDNAVIAASGDIGCLGRCEIDIQDPFRPNGSIATLHSSLKRVAISTSGNYERYIKSKKYNHLLNPKTGIPEQYYASITLVDTHDNTRIDALATAVSVMEATKAINLLKSLKIGYILINNNGEITKSAMPEGVVLTML